MVNLKNILDKIVLGVYPIGVICSIVFIIILSIGAPVPSIVQFIALAITAGVFTEEWFKALNKNTKS